MKKFITLVFALSSLYGGITTLHAGPLTYSIPITVTNSEAQLNDFQVKLNIDTQALIAQGKLKSSCEDIRVLDVDGITDIPYWVESGCNTGSTIVWVKVPVLVAYADTTIYFSYGDLNAVSLSNAASVFEFYEDFNGNALDGSKWTVMRDDLGYDVSGGRLNIHMSGGPSRRTYIDSNYQYNSSVMVETKTYISSTYGLSGKVSNIIHWYTGKLLVSTGNLPSGADQGVSYPQGQDIITREIYDFDTNQAQVCYEQSCTGFYPVGLNMGQTSGVLEISALDHSYSSGSNDSYNVDWVRVRKYVPQYPVITTGQEVVNGPTPPSPSCQAAIDQAYIDGQAAGYSSGYNAGVLDGYDSGYQNGLNIGYSNGYSDGYANGYQVGQIDGYASGYTDGYVNGQAAGYNSGYAAAVAACQADPASCGIASIPGQGKGTINPSNGGLPPGQAKK